MNVLDAHRYRLGNAIYRRNVPLEQVVNGDKTSNVVKNVEEDEQSDYEEGCNVDIAGEEELDQVSQDEVHVDDDETNIVFDRTKKIWNSSVNVPDMIMGRFIGTQGANRKRLEESTQCRIQTPARGSGAPVVITSVVSRASVQSCLDQIELFMAEQRNRSKPNHFVSLPIESGSVVVDNYNMLVNLIRDMPDIPENLKDPSLYSSPQKLHLTVGVLTLFDETELNQVVSVLDNVVSTKIRSLTIEFAGLDHFGDEDGSSCRVLYAKPSGNQLKEMSEIIYNALLDSGFAKKQRAESLVLHMTVMKISEGMDPFDATPILQTFKEYYFGECNISSVKLCVMHEVDTKTGGYQVKHTTDLVQPN